MFAPIKPKRYDVPWHELEGQGFIAAAECTEIRVPQDAEQQMAYAIAPKRQQFRIAAENPRKLKVVKDLLQKEIGHRILIIGEFIEQLERIAQLTELPLITRKTPQRERDRRYEQFRNQELDALILQSTKLHLF